MDDLRLCLYLLWLSKHPPSSSHVLVEMYVLCSMDTATRPMQVGGFS